MRVWKYGDDINTDMLFPGKYTYTCATAAEIRPHLLEDLDPSFAAEVQAGDLFMAGRNFGCGSSREQPALGLKAVGIAAVIAASYSRIFFRAAINQGLLLIECPQVVAAYQPGAPLHLDLAGACVETGGATFPFPPLPSQILAIRDAGGLLPYTRARVAAKAR